MTEADWYRAALLYAPADACFTGVTRLQQLGLDVGPHRPLQMVVGRDLHRDAGEVFIHRTDRLPDHDGRAVLPAGVFVEACRTLSVRDAVAAGDWLLSRRLVTRQELVGLCRRDAWRAGVEEALWILPLLDARSRSVPESHGRLLFEAAGLPRPEVNRRIEVTHGVILTPDWWWQRFRVASEYEGSHHQVDRSQYLADLDRYRVYREGDVAYQQLTKEMMARPAAAVSSVHRLLVARGYVGPAPDLGRRLDAVTLAVPVARMLVPDLSPAPKPPARRRDLAVER